MSNDNTQREKQIDDIVAEYKAKTAVLKQKRNKIISDFLQVLKEKKLAELREQIKQL